MTDKEILIDMFNRNKINFIENSDSLEIEHADIDRFSTFYFKEDDSLGSIGIYG